MPVFVTFEGCEGSGKSVQARLLKGRLVREGHPALLLHEPGGTPMGQRLRRWLKGASYVSPQAEVLLFAASRAELVRGVMLPALEKGVSIVCDRYADSTLAYQGYGRGLDLGLVRAINGLATGNLVPHLTVLLDLSPEVGLQRKGKGRDRFEREDMSFHRRVREGYLKMAREEPHRWLVLDGTASRKALADLVWQAVSARLGHGSWPPGCGKVYT